jgi:riboflavin transporter FmnP
MTKKQNIRALTISSIMSAAGFILMLFDFSIPIMPSFIKLDFSDLPALITSFCFGPLWGVLVCFIKNLLHFLLDSSTMGIGEISNFLLGAFFVAVAGTVYRKKKTRAGALIGSTLGAFSMAAAGVVTNYFIVYPLYVTVLNMPEKVILSMYQAILPSVDSLIEALCIFNFPFTFVKGMIVTLITFFIYKKLSPILKGKIYA